MHNRLNSSKQIISIHASLTIMTNSRKGVQGLQLFTETHLKATKSHLPYGITQCYLPPNTGEHVPP